MSRRRNYADAGAGLVTAIIASRSEQSCTALHGLANHVTCRSEYWSESKLVKETTTEVKLN